MTKKKWLSVLLAVVLVAALLPTMAWADTATSKPWTTGDGYGTAEDAGNGWYVLNISEHDDRSFCFIQLFIRR